MTLRLLNFILYFYTQSYNYKLIYKYNSCYIGILDIFWDYGLIYGYKIIYTDIMYIIIYPKKTKNNEKLFSLLKIYSLPSKRKFISTLELNYFINKEKGYTLFIISTPVGILDGCTAVKKGLGGELLLKLSF